MNKFKKLFMLLGDSLTLIMSFLFIMSIIFSKEISICFITIFFLICFIIMFLSTILRLYFNNKN